MGAKVTLITHTPMPEQTIAAAAKLCYSPATIDTVMEGLDFEKSASFVNMLSQIGHESPIEHASFTFGVENVSRSFLAQVTRHRMASFSVQSQRYVAETQFEYVIPPEIEKIPAAKEKFIKAMQDTQNTYNELADMLKSKYYDRYMLDGIDEKEAKRKAEKKAIEDARFVLPNACCTKMIITMNARSLMNFFSLRCCNRAQWEIRDVANQMLKLCVQTAPALFKKAGPSCVRGKCTEGKMSCGRTKEVREFYMELKESK